MRLRENNLTWQVVDDQVIVLDLNGSVYLQVNGSGKLLWETLAAGATEASLAATLIDTYGIEAERAAADVAAFVADLRQRRLVDE